MDEVKKGKASGYFKGIGYGLLMIVIFYAIQTVVSIPVIVVSVINYINTTGMMPNEDTAAFMAGLTESGMLTNVTAVDTVVTAIVFGLWYYLKFGRKSTRKLGTILKECFSVKKTVLYVLAAVFAYLMALNTISVINLVSPKATDFYTEMMNMISSGNQGILLITVAVLAPIGEECLFRGLVMQKLYKYTPAVVAIILQALLFGLFHMNLVQGFYVLFLGVVCGYAAYRTGSVFPAIFMHLINNLMSTLLQLLPQSILENDVIWVIVPLVPLALFCVLFKQFGYRIGLKEEA